MNPLGGDNGSKGGGEANAGMPSGKEVLEIIMWKCDWHDGKIPFQM